MKTSVLIIAHNEEKYIEKCITSILNQNEKPDEIVLVAHNCADKTVEISKKYPIKIIEFKGETGIIQARLKGIENLSGDIILCIDGDSCAEKNWIEEMKKLFQKNVVLIGSYVKLSGGIFNSIGNFFNKLSCTKSNNATHWIWGPSFGFLGKDKDKIQTGFLKSIEIREKLKLSRDVDDYMLGLFIKRYGDIRITNKTYVTTNIKERGFLNEVKRSIENIQNGLRVDKFLKNSLKN